jgi:hypothetical protein
LCISSSNAAGPRVDIRDLLWDGTPADWAYHGGRVEIEAYLRARMKEADGAD